MTTPSPLLSTSTSTSSPLPSSSLPSSSSSSSTSSPTPSPLLQHPISSPPNGGHPRGRIGELRPGLPPIFSEKGELRPERALAYNQSALLLHDVAATRIGHHFSAAELAGYGKSASRVIALTARFPWVDLQPLEWLSPEQLLFTTGSDALFYDLVVLWSLLEQAEALTLHTLELSTFLAFRRC